MTQQGAKKIIFTACHSGKLKLAFASPDDISTSSKNFLTSRIDFTVLLLFEFLIGQVKTEFTSPIAKSTSPRLSTSINIVEWSGGQNNDCKFGICYFHITVFNSKLSAWWHTKYLERFPLHEINRACNTPVPPGRHKPDGITPNTLFTTVHTDHRRITHPFHPANPIIR